MKNISRIFILTLLLAAFSTYTLRAQTPPKTKAEYPTRFGVKGGINYSNLYGPNIDHTESLVGYNVGLFAKLPLVKMVAIQPEVYFTTKGADVTYSNVFAGTARFKLNYIELPLLVMVNLTPNFNFHIGPYASVLINGIVRNRSTITVFDFERNIDNNDYNRLDAGLALGGGIDVGAFGIGARYNLGLTTIGKERTFAGTNYTFPNGSHGVLNFYVSLGIN